MKRSLALAFVLACSPKPAPAPLASAPAPAPPPARSARAHARPRVLPPDVRPEVGLREPMKGESADAAVASRLVPTSCGEVNAEAAERRVAKMREDVERQYRVWHDDQPSCWAAMREEYRLRHAPMGSGDAIGDAFGVGGLGLSGVGEGGGGIGMGSIGSGHAARGPVIRAGTMSVTNNQVAAVDEADMVKTDGSYVYLAASGALRIFEAMKPRLVSTTPIAGTVREIFVEGDRAVVYASSGAVREPCTYGYDCQFGGDATSTRVSVFDVSNRASPRLERQIELSGSLIAARRIGHTVHTVVADGDGASPPWQVWPRELGTCGHTEAEVRAALVRLKAENEKKIRAEMQTVPTLTERGASTAMCNGLLRTPIRDGNAFTSIVSFDLAAPGQPPSTTTLQSRPGAVFASESALYLAVTHGRTRRHAYYPPDVDEVSDVHKFRIGSSPEETAYVGSGTVPGHVLNQFAMDEWYGYLRIATTRGRVPDPKVQSTLSVLAEGAKGGLTRIGAIEKIAPGEDIRSVRFDGERGYIVTFKKTDPLFVMDLARPDRPAIAGELKIPGFSTYMHRIDRDHLLSIGFDANDHGDFAFFDGVILQLFDVSKAASPRLLHKEKIGTRGSSSEAATNHLAFNYLASEGRLAVPMTICEGGADGRNGDTVSFSGLLVYDVDVERGFTRLGGVDHSARGVTCATWWSRATSAVKRSVFLDDLVYSVAGDRVKVQNQSRLGLDVADFALTENTSEIRN